MKKMKLSYVENINTLAISEEECNRLVSLLDEGEALYYKSELGTITLTDSVMIISGFDNVPTVFGAVSASGLLDIRAACTHRLKSKVRKIIFDEGTRVISYRAFADFTELCRVDIPDSVERICSPFENCKKLMPYPLPMSLKYISGDAYGIYPDEVVLPDGVENIDSFFSKSGVRTVTLSPAVKQLEMRSFFKCEKLEKVIFPEGLSIIREEAFSFCRKLSELVFPKSLTEIEAYAFAYCESLSKVTVTGNTEIDSNAFINSPYHQEVQRLRFDAFEPLIFDKDASSLHDFEKMKNILQGKKLSEQALYFKLLTDNYEETSSYRETDRVKHYGGTYPLGDEADVENLITHEGIIVGAVINGIRVYLGTRECLGSTVKHDGTGELSICSYRALIFDEPNDSQTSRYQIPSEYI